MARPEGETAIRVPKWSVWLCGIFLLCLASGSLRAEPSAFFYVLDKVVVQGGLPIEDITEGVIYESGLDGCSPELSPGLPVSAKPVAGSLGAEVRLDLELRSCPPGAPPPSGQCQLRVGSEPTLASAILQGWTATISIPLPSATGVYPLELRCTIGEQEARLDGTLFLLYGKGPISPVTEPPPAEIYQAASTWGAGLTAGDPETAVLLRILGEMHNFGQRHWRYGYCTRTEDYCIFGETVLSRNSPLLDSIRLDVCRWQVLVSSDSKCNFTDCVGFSEMYRYIAAMMGIGGLALKRETGSMGRGFVTQGWLISLDPKAGSFECGYRNLLCAFVFGKHFPLERDGVFYDAAFGVTYPNTHGLIAASIFSSSRKTGLLKFVDGMRACLLNRPSYGKFPYFRQVAPHTEECPIDDTHPASFVDNVQDFPSGAVELESIEGDKRPELINVHLLVDVETAGGYIVFGTIRGGPDGEMLAVSRPRFRDQTVVSNEHIEGPPGVYPVTLRFSGEDLVHSNVPPPYWIDASIISSWGLSDHIHRRLPAFSLQGLGEQAARLSEISKAEKAARPGQSPALRVTVPVAVRTAGPYAVAARLASGGETLAYSGFRRELPEGDHVLTVDFPGDEIAAHGIKGRYDVTVELHRLDPETGLPFEFVDTAERELGSFDAADFHP